MATSTLKQPASNSSDAGHTKDVEGATLMLDEVDSRLDSDCKKLRALATAVMRLLAGTVDDQRVFYLNEHNKLTHGEHQEALWALRNGITAASDLADMIDDLACSMGERTQEELVQARHKLGLPPPDWTIRKAA